MMFDMPDNIEIVDSEVHKVGEELDVAISIKPKRNQTTRSVLIRAQVRITTKVLPLMDNEDNYFAGERRESNLRCPLSTSST